MASETRHQRTVLEALVGRYVHDRNFAESLHVAVRDQQIGGFLNENGYGEIHEEVVRYLSLHPTAETVRADLTLHMNGELVSLLY
jgi:hypothetical protein